MNDKASLLVITGTVGVGKSTVADTIYEILKARSLPIALINLDEFGYANVQPDDPHKVALRFKNLQVVWKNYRDAGVKYVVIPWVVESDEDIRLFRMAMPEVDVHVALLTASIAVVQERLTARLLGGSLGWHLNRAKELSEVFKTSQIADISIDTDQRTIVQVSSALITDWLEK